MHPAIIKSALQVAGYTQAEVAKMCKVEQNTISAVIHGRGRSRRVEAKISELTGLPLYQLWPDNYRPDNKPVPRRRVDPQAVLRTLEQSGLAAKAASLKAVANG